jgi:uncharacterized coiled-coil protein SlyX
MIVSPCWGFECLYITCFFQVVNWYLGSVRLFNDRISEKDRMIAKMDEVVVEKNRVIAKMDEVVAEKNRMVAEKNKRIAEKDKAIQRLEESTDIATALRDTRRAETGRK